MDRFDTNDERLVAFIESLWKALVPETGECISVQGELVRACGRLQNEHFRNGLCNYYAPDEPDQDLAGSYYGGLLLFMTGMLIENRNGPLDAAEVAYFTDVRTRAFEDWRVQRRIDLLRGDEEEGRKLTKAERAEVERLEAAEGRLDFEELFDRSEIAVANYCVANPELFDRKGKPVVERGIRDIRELFERPPPGTVLH